MSFWPRIVPTKTAHAKTSNNTQPNETNKNCPIIHPHIHIYTHINTYALDKEEKKK